MVNTFLEISIVSTTYLQVTVAWNKKTNLVKGQELEPQFLKENTLWTSADMRVWEENSNPMTSALGKPTLVSFLPASRIS